MKTPLLDQIISYCHNPKTPFHMPAHNGGRGVMPKLTTFFGLNVFKADLTELDELDNLNNPEGVIKETQEKISTIFDSKASYLLINGSTGGLMTLVSSLTKEGEKVLINRNCHRSIMNGLIASGAEPVWLMPEWLPDWELFGAILPETLDEQLENNPDIKAVFITSPSYEGIVSDTKALAAICKKHRAKLIVDEAHGGHWHFNNKFPDSALQCGADAVVQSFHKSCGSLSQSSILHISKTSDIDLNNIEENLKLFQSTSPSYLLMASLDAASSYLASPEGNKVLESTYKYALELREQLKKIPKIKVLENTKDFNIDPTRLFLSIEGLSGLMLGDIIEENYHIAIESFNNRGNLFFLNIGNSKDDFDKLYDALKEVASGNYESAMSLLPEPNRPVMNLSPRKAFYSESIKLKIKEAMGKTVKYPYVKCPPGVCMLIPGEQITDYHLNFFGPDDEIDVIN